MKESTLLGLFIITVLIVCSIAVVTAFTYTQIGHTNAWIIGFSDGRNGTAYGVSYDRKFNVLSAVVNMSDGGGMTMREIAELHSWADAQNGIVGKASTATINITH